MAGISTMWPFPVRLLGYSWIFVCFLIVAANGQKDKCDALTKDIVLMNDPEFCEYHSIVLGHPTGFVKFNFSNTDSQTVNNLFARKFTRISGVIVMEGNNKVDRINFAQIGQWDGGFVPASK